MRQTLSDVRADIGDVEWGFPDIGAADTLRFNFFFRPFFSLRGETPVPDLDVDIRPTMHRLACSSRCVKFCLTGEHMFTYAILYEPATPFCTHPGLLSEAPT